MILSFSFLVNEKTPSHTLRRRALPVLPLLFISASQQKPYQVLSIPCRCNRRTCHCLSCPQQCLSKAIFHLLHTYPSHHTGFLCNAVCTCTLFFHEFSYVKILSHFKGFVKREGNLSFRTFIHKARFRWGLLKYFYSQNFHS